MQAAEEHWYRAVESRDNRFDGWIYLGVTSTGVYCRPSCPAVSPKRANMRFYRSAAAAQRAGFRACKRCRPDASPGSPEWNARADVVARAMRLIADGVVDREGVAGARGAPRLQRAAAQPARLGRARRRTARARARTARADGAHADRDDRPRLRRGRVRGGLRERAAVQRHRARGLRAHAARAASAARDAQRRSAPGRSRCASPTARRSSSPRLLAFLGRRAIAGRRGGHAGRRLPAHAAPAARRRRSSSSRPATAACSARCRLADVRDLGVAVARCRRLLDLDADPVAVAAALGERSAARAARARPPRHARPRLRRRHRDRRARRARPAGLRRGRAHARGAASCSATASRWRRPTASLTHLFPTAAALAEADDDVLAMPASAARDAARRRARRCATAPSQLDPGADREAARRDAARAARASARGRSSTSRCGRSATRTRSPPATSACCTALRALGVEVDAREAERRSQAWRPFRSYAVLHLWQRAGERGVSEAYTTMREPARRAAPDRRGRAAHRPLHAG